jgi:hypothetical protein
LRSIERPEYNEIAQSVREGRYSFDIVESQLTVALRNEVAIHGTAQGS